MSSDEVNRFLQGSNGKSFAFEAVGDTVSGMVKSFDLRQQTNLDDGTLAFWPDGKPRMMVVVNLQTELRDDDSDDGIRVLYARGGNYQVAEGKGAAMTVAIFDAMKRAGKKDFEEGAKLTVQYAGKAVQNNRAYSQAKLYTATYQPPVNRVDMEELL